VIKYSVEEVRARFEAWVSVQSWFKATVGLAHNDHGYNDPCINTRWQGWQAAYAEHIEPVAQGEAYLTGDAEEVAESLGDDAAQVRDIIGADSEIADNMERAAEILRTAAQPRAVPVERVAEGWRETFVEPLEDYAGARAEVAIWNVTQRVQPDGGVRLPRSRLAKLMAHVDLLAAAPSPGESNNKPIDCSGDPSSCPDNEGRGCYCSDLHRKGESA